MPGEANNPGRWGDLPLVIDKSAWARATNAAVVADWAAVVRANRFRISPVARLELLFSARDARSLERLAEEVSAFRAAPLSATTVRAAESAMIELAQRSASSHRIPIADYLIAASAQEIGAAVLHYDHDYDTLAEVMAFESAWLAEPRTLP